MAITGSTQLSKHADVRVAGRQVRAKAQQALYRDRGTRCTVDREPAEGSYAQLPAWSHRDQWLYLVQMAAAVWFPEQIHRQVRIATLLKFAALVAAFADDETGRDCRRVYPELARDMAVSVETVRKCWRALERLGLAVQVEPSKCFSFAERMRIWRLERSKQRGMTPEYALVVPAAYARALTTGEHPADLLAHEPGSPGVPAGGNAAAAKATPTPIQKLSAALSKLRGTYTASAAPGAAEAPAGGSDSPPELSPGVKQSPTATGPVDNSRPDPFKRLRNIDILGLPRSGPRQHLSTCLRLVNLVPHGVKSTASRAHNQGGSAGGTPGRGTQPGIGAQKRRAGRGGWFGAHRDIAVHLTRRVPWLRGVQPGRIAMQLKRFTVPGLPKIWRPEDFVTAMDAINRRQHRYSPGANLAAQTKTDLIRAQRAEAGAVRSPQALLKWYLEQLDPANDHPRFELDTAAEQHRASWNRRREAAAAAAEHLAAIGMDAQRRAEVRTQQAALARRLMGTPPVTSLRNRR